MCVCVIVFGAPAVEIIFGWNSQYGPSTRHALREFEFAHIILAFEGSQYQASNRVPFGCPFLGVTLFGVGGPDNHRMIGDRFVSRVPKKRILIQFRALAGDNCTLELEGMGAANQFKLSPKAKHILFASHEVMVHQQPMLG